MIILPSNSSGEYEVANSLRFNDGSSDYLSRTPSTATSLTTWTLSFWIKRSQIGTEQRIISQGSSSSNFMEIALQSGDTLRWRQYTGSYEGQLITNRLFRDVSAWYNIVCQWNTTDGTADDRMKIYVNGVEETSFSTRNNPTSSRSSLWNSTTGTMDIGRRSVENDQFLDGYMTETVFIDGQALDPTSFGEFDEDSSVWKPINVSGLTFGTNGFYLDFENSGSLGADVSGNGNNFTVNNLTSIDQTSDSCTNNFATFNPLGSGANVTFSEGNLKPSDDGTSHTSMKGIFISTIGVSTGKWYAEFKYDDSDSIVGIATTTKDYKGLSQYYLGQGTLEYGLDSNGTPTIYTNGSGTTYGSGSTSSGDIVSVALDLDNNKLYFAKNGTYYNSGNPATNTNGHSITAGEYYFAGGHGNLSQLFANFGNPPFSISSGNSDGNGYGNFEYAVPSGYYSLNSKNLAEYG